MRPSKGQRRTSRSSEQPSHDSGFICALTKYDPCQWPSAMWSSVYILLLSVPPVFKAEGHFESGLSDADITCKKLCRQVCLGGWKMLLCSSGLAEQLKCWHLDHLYTQKLHQF